MGKAAMCIKMLQLLNTGRVFKISELAELLDTNPRNIVEYKKELDEVAMDNKFYIETIPGRYGGYKLNGSAILPPLKLNPVEHQALDKGFSYLLKRNDFLEKDDFIKSMSKIYSTLAKNNFENDLLIINRYPLSMPEEEIKYRFDILNSAIRLKQAVKLKYISQKNVEKEHLYHPYDLFMYNNAWFVIGWCETWNDIVYFKLNRITDLHLYPKTFRIPAFYNKSDYIDEYGFKNNGDWYHVEFIASGTYASLVKERKYGKNQVVEAIDDKHTKVSVDMQNQENILVFILGFNRNIEVLEPDWLKEKLVDTGKYLIEKYREKNV